MSVIGRLDEQVDAVLITPLNKRGEHKEDEARQGARSAERAEAVSETKRQATGDDGTSEQERAARPDDLPVWLL